MKKRAKSGGSSSTGGKGTMGSSSQLHAFPRSSLPSTGFGSPMTSSHSNSGFTQMNILLNMESDLEPSLVVIIKKTLKKDTQTKTRAVQELLDYVSSHQNEELLSFLTYWPSIFNRIGLDYDRRVREIVAAIHAKIVERLSKQVAPILKSVIGTWLCLTFDPFPTVSKVAISSFDSSFKEKRVKVLEFCLSSILEFLSEMLVESTPESLGDPRQQTPEEMMSKYSRIVSCSFSVLRVLFLELPGSVLDNARDLKTLLDDNRLWGLCAHESTLVRRSFYTFVKYAQIHRKDDLKSRLDLVSNAFLAKAFSERDPSAHGDLWEAILLVLKNTPEAWTIASTKKPMLGKLVFFLKNGAFGSVQVTYPSLLPLLAQLPPNIWSEGKDTNPVLTFFESFWKGACTIEQSSSHVFVTSFLECIIFMCSREGRVSPDTQKLLLLTCFFRPLYTCWYPHLYPECKTRFNDEKVASITASFMVKIWSQPSIPRELVQDVAHSFETVILQSLDEQMDGVQKKELDDIQLEYFCYRLSQFLASLYSISKPSNPSTTSFNEFFEKLIQKIFSSCLNQTDSDPFPGLDHLLKSMLDAFGKRLVHNQDTRKLLRQVMTDKLESIIDSFLSGSTVLIDSYFHVLKLFSVISISKHSKDRSTQSSESQMLWDSLMSAVVNLESRTAQFRLLYYSFREAGERKLVGAMKLQSEKIDKIIKTALHDSLDNQYYVELISLCLSTNIDDEEMLDVRTVDTLMDFIKNVMKQTSRVLVVENPAAHEIPYLLLKETLFSLYIIRRIVDSHTQQKFSDVSHLLDLFGRLYMHVTEYAAFRVDSVTRIVFTDQPSHALDGMSLLERIHAEALEIQRPLGLSLLRMDCEDLDSHFTSWLHAWKASFLNPKHSGNPTDFLSQIHEFFELSKQVPKRSSNLKDRILATVILDQNAWQDASVHFELSDESLAQHDLLCSFAPILKHHRNAAESSRVTKIVYHLDGLSLYARMALVVLGLVKDGMLGTLKSEKNQNPSHPADNSDVIVENLDEIDVDAVNPLEEKVQKEISFDWIWIELIRFRQVCQDLLLLCLPPGKSLWKTTVPIQVETIVDEISQLLNRQGAYTGVPVYGLGQHILTRIALSQPSADTDFGFFALAIHAFDNSIASFSRPKLRLSYARVFSFVLRKIFAAHGLWTEDETDIWFKILGTLEKDGEGEFLVSAAIISALNNDIQISPSTKSGQSYAKHIIELFVHMSRNAFDDTNKMEQVHHATIQLILLLPLIASEVKMDQSILDRNIFHQIITIIRTWYDPYLTNPNVTDATQLNTIEKSPQAMMKTTSALICRLLEKMIGMHLDISLNLARFIVDLTAHWITKLEHKEDIIQSPSDLTLLIHVLQLWTRLRDVVDDDQDHWSHVYEVQTKLTFVFIKLFILFGLERNISAPVMEIQSLLANLIESITITDPEMQDAIPYATLCSLIFSTNENVQKVSFSLLERWTKFDVQKNSLSLEMNTSGSADLSVDNAYILPTTLISALTPPEHVMEDHHQLFGYFLAWMILFSNMTDATYQLKTGYVRQLRETNSLESLLTIVFDVLDVGRDVTPFDLSLWDIQSFAVDGFDFDSELSMPLFSAHLYWRCIMTLPSLVRNWWTECRNRQLVQAVERYTQDFFTPALIQREVKTIEDKRADLPDLSVKSVQSANVLCAAYKIEDSVVELVIRFPQCFPLRLVEVESGKGTEKIAGINEGRWRAWLLAISAVMTAHNGSAADAMALFHKNVSLHFEGIEDCAICYSIICVVDRTVPNKQCKTCKHLFHGSCLFKWFKSSNQSTCPLCRQLF